MSRETDRKERKNSRKLSSSSRRKSENGRSSRVKHNKKDDSKLPKNAKKITEEDYFRRQTEFRVWLAQTKSKYVDDLSTTEAIELFTAEFAKKWNRGKLATMFYDGLPEVVVEQTKRTRHRWGFVAKLGDKEKFELATAKDSVDVATKRENLLGFGGKRDKKAPRVNKKSKHRKKEKRRLYEDKDDDRDEDKKRRKVERRKEREHRDTVMDELVPKATGRQAQIEKRRQVGARLHGAARDREDARDGLDLSEDFLMGGRGGDTDNLKQQLARRGLARRRKQEEQEEKLGQLKAKESARMDKFLEDMGLAGPNADGRKSATIAPRQ